MRYAKEILDSINRLNNRENQKWMMSLNNADLIDFLADVGVDETHKNLWKYTRNSLEKLAWLCLTKHPYALIDWANLQFCEQ